MGVKGIGLGVGLILASTCAQANPEGPQVVHGTASFVQPNAHTLNVTNSHNAVINWQGFSIGPGQTTNFIQPGSNSAVLNRVIGNNPSQILGNLNSNGKVFLINQHGLMIGAGARISTAGFYGSTLNITNEDFLNGKLRFEGGGLGGIQNHGYIHAGPNGNVVLIAPDIENGGVIEVDNGNVILAAGESITITSLNDASIEFDVQSPDNGIINLGSIIANQGAARLFAGNLKHSGAINATGIVQNADGSISLVALGKLEVDGSIAASGGRIELLADDIKIRSGAFIDVSGADGGGEILIGGDQQGLNPAIRNAISTTIEAGAEVHADATENGDGGRVIVFAEQDVHVHGEITARGGADSGDGGFIETSGLQALDITRVPDAGALNGEAGEWLIDPFDIAIVAAGANDPPDYTAPFTSALASTTLSAGLINTALLGGTSVTITTGGGGSQLGNITLDAPIVSNATSGASLTLSAHNDIRLNFDITAPGGPLDLTLIADNDFNGAGKITANAVIDLFGGTLSMSAPDVSILNNVLAGSASFNGVFNQFAGDSTYGGNVTFNGAFNMLGGSATFNGGATLDGVGNTWTGGTISGSAPLVLAGSPGTTKLTLAGSATKTLDGITLDTNANDVDVFGSGDLDLVNGAIVLNQGGGLSFHHFGEGDITSTDASGLFDNDSSLFTNFVGTTVVAVDFTNNAQVLTLGGILSFTGNFINNDTVNVAGGILQVADAEANDIGIYNVSGGALVFSANRVLNGSLSSSGIVLVDNGATLTLPASLTNLGALELNNASLDLSGLPASTLQMDASILGGTGTVLGNVVNNSGLLVVGGTGAIGNLTISGNYTQNPASAMVVEVFNNGFSTISDQLIVTGATQLNGGTLVIGFTTTSLGLVTSSFRPFIFSGGLSGSFGQVIDAGGNILLIDVSGGIFTILGASPTIPEEILADLVEYLEQQLALAQLIASNRARAEKIAEKIREQEEGEAEGALVCKIAL